LPLSALDNTTNGSQHYRHKLTSLCTLHHDMLEDLQRFTWLESSHQYRYLTTLLSPEV
jgi:hypothetical protein